jgi:hypothetical protein
VTIGAMCPKQLSKRMCRGGCGLEHASNEAGGLRTLLDEIATETTRRSEYWSQSAAPPSNRLARATALLIAKSCIVERRRSGERKVIVIPSEVLTMVMLIK